MKLKLFPDLVTLTSQRVHSRVPPGPWGLVFLDPVTVGSLELRPLQRRRCSRRSGHGGEDAGLGTVPALQLPSLARCGLHGVL